MFYQLRTIVYLFSHISSFIQAPAVSIIKESIYYEDITMHFINNANLWSKPSPELTVESLFVNCKELRR